MLNQRVIYNQCHRNDSPLERGTTLSPKTLSGVIGLSLMNSYMTIHADITSLTKILSIFTVITQPW